MNDSNTAARIGSLRRYISLLRQEEKRLAWLSTSTVVTTVERKDAEDKARSISEKLKNAERELSDLELKKPSRHT